MQQHAYALVIWLGNRLRDRPPANRYSLLIAVHLHGQGCGDLVPNLHGEFGS